MPEIEDVLRRRLREDSERVRPDVDAAWSKVASRLDAERLDGASAAPSGPPPPSRAPAWQRHWWAAPVAAALVAMLAALALVPDDPSTSLSAGDSGAGDQAGEPAEERSRMQEDDSYSAPSAASESLEAHDGSAGTAGSFDGMFPAASWEAYDRLRDEVAAGRQLWTLDPGQVARAFLRERTGEEQHGQVVRREDSAAEYEWSGGRVVLWRSGPDSPWVVTASHADGGELGR